MDIASRPLVSIVVCTYNGAQFLAAQLDTLLQQTYAPLEILISDDSSTDDTVAIARTYAEKDARIRLHVHLQNVGYNRNFEQAFEMAAGAFIAVCDQDDLWKPGKIEAMMPLFENEQTLLVHAQSVRFTDVPPAVDHYTARALFEGNDLRQILFFNTIAGHNMIFRKTLLVHAAPFPPDVFYDWWLAITAAAYGRVAGTTAVYSFHRAHASNLTLGKKDERKQTRKKADERLRTIRRVLALPGLSASQKDFASQLCTALSTLERKRFSFPLFSFLLRHAAVVFFFKKKSWFSKAKMAYRMSFAE